MDTASTPIVYSLPNCPQCDQTKRLFKNNGIEFKEVDISKNEEKRAQFRSMGVRSAPVVEMGTDWWSGFKQDKIQAVINALSPNHATV